MTNFKSKSWILALFLCFQNLGTVFGKFLLNVYLNTSICCYREQNKLYSSRVMNVELCDWLTWFFEEEEVYVFNAGNIPFHSD